MPSSDQRAARQSLWLGATTAVQVLGSIAHVSVSARILGPEGFGVLAVIIAVCGLLYRLLAVPGNEVITTYVTRSLIEGRQEEAISTIRFALFLNQALSLVSYALIVLLVVLAPDLLELGEHHVLMMPVYGVTGLLMATTRETLAVVRLADRLSLAFAVETLAALVKAAVLVVAWRTNGGLPWVIWAYVAGNAVTGVGLFIVAATSAQRAGVPGYLRSLSAIVPRPEIVRFQLAGFLRSSVEAVALHLDVILIASLVNTSQLGLYRAALQIMDATKHPFRCLAVGIQPALSRHWYGRNFADLRGACRRFTALSLVIAAAGYGLLVLVYQPLILLFFGSEFAAAARPLLLMLPGAVCFAAVAAVHVLPAATGRALPHLLASLAALAAQVVAVAWLVPEYGAEGAAGAYTVYFLVFAVVFAPFASAVLKQCRQGQGNLSHADSGA